MGKVKYAILAIFLILCILAGLSFFLFPFGKGEKIHYRNGEPLVELIPADFTPVVEKVAPAVVRIIATTYSPPKQSVGTGVIIDSKLLGGGYIGYIITNRHVVKDAATIQVYLADRENPISVASGMCLSLKIQT